MAQLAAWSEEGEIVVCFGDARIVAEALVQPTGRLAGVSDRPPDST